MTSSLYDDWGWDDAPTQADLEEINAERRNKDQEDAPDPFPDDEEFYYANKLKLKFEAKQGEQPPKPGFLQIWEDETRTTPIASTAQMPNVVKRSDGYKPPASSPQSAIGSVAKTPIVPGNTSPYSATYKNPYSQPAQTQAQPTQPVQRTSTPPIPGMIQSSQMANAQSQYQPVSNNVAQSQPVQTPQYGYTTTPVSLIADYELGRKIIDSTPLGNIPDLPRPDRMGTTIPIPRPRHKVSRQLFLTINSMLLANAIHPDKLNKQIDKMVEATIPKADNENEICLYNADEMLRQMVIQIVGTREDNERLIILGGIKKILDIYLPTQVSQKEFIKTQNITYPHPAYVGIQASLDTLNYIYIWTGNVERVGKGKTLITYAIGQYLNKYRGRLNPLPLDVGLSKAKTIFYYDFNG